MTIYNTGKNGLSHVVVEIINNNNIYYYQLFKRPIVDFSIKRLFKFFNNQSR